MFDGAILVTNLDWWGEAGREHPHIPFLRWCEPRHVIWHCWAALHAGTVPLYVNDDGQFPRNNPPDGTAKPVSGRKRSGQRADSEYYQSIDSEDATVLPQMKPFLNYVSFSGETIAREDVSIIRACLASRQTNTSQAPVWGYHETFQIGHWAFYALLSTTVGTELTKLLYEHKTPQHLGKKVVRSITVYAADSYFRQTPPGVDNMIQVKWPVLLFHIGDFDEDTKRRRQQIEKLYVGNTGDHKQTHGFYNFPEIAYQRLAAETSDTCPRIVLPSTMTWQGASFPGNSIFAERYDGLRMKYL